MFIIFNVPTGADTEYLALSLIHKLLHQLVHLHDFLLHYFNKEQLRLSVTGVSPSFQQFLN